MSQLGKHTSHMTGLSLRISKHPDPCFEAWSVALLYSAMPHLLVTERNDQRRSAVRYMLQLPVIFYWNDASEHTAAGFTYDVALDGALIRSSVCPPVGCDIRIEVLIPSPDQSHDQIRIQCSGKVTRSTSEDGRSSFGVRGFFDDDHITRQLIV